MVASSSAAAAALGEGSSLSSARHSDEPTETRTHARREASGRTEDDDNDGEDADMIPLLSFTQPSPNSTGAPPGPGALPPSYEDALELGPASASEHHPPVRLRSLYRANRAGSSRWREFKEHIGSMHHLLPEPVVLCVRGTGTVFASIFGGLGKRARTYLTCSCMPPQQRLSLAFAFLSFVTVLLIIAQPWIDTSGMVQGGMTAEEVSATIDQPDLILAVGESIAVNATWRWKRCSSEGEALRWQRRTYCTSTSSLSFTLPVEKRADDSTLEILFDRVSLDTDRIAASGKAPPGSTSSGTAPGKIEVIVDQSGKHTRFTNEIKVEMLAKYDEDAQPLLEKSTVVVTKIGTPDETNLHRLRILTPTLPEIFNHEFNNVWNPHAPLQMSIKVWIPSTSQLHRNGGNDRQGLPRLRIATAIADVGLLRFGSGEEGDRDGEGYEEEEFALRGRELNPLPRLTGKRAPTTPAPSTAYFPSVHISTLSGRIAVGANTVLAARHAVELRTHFPHNGVYADAVARAGKERGNRLSSFGSLRAGRGRGQIDIHGSTVLGASDELFKDIFFKAPNQGSVKLSTAWSQDSTITVWGGATVRAASLEVNADPAGIFLKKGAKFVKDQMVVKGPIKHE
ncbi:hypothetical protein OC844_000560 [Tilletia horrida]|nr:hypothetical protein OC844_000560 [Tilletia horrida]